MGLFEITTMCLGHSYAARIALQGGRGDLALAELTKLRELLNNQPILEAGDAPETPLPERSKL